MNRQYLPRVFVCGLLLLHVGHVFAAPPQGDRTIQVKFPAGRTSTVIKQAVVRGTTDYYIVMARRNQRLIVHLASVENNAVFNISRRGESRKLPKAEETTDWDGRLASTGDYAIAVSGLRGNATYTLSVTLR